MIRVLHVVNRMGYGGIETFIMNIYRNIDRSKVQFDFAVYSNEKGEYDDEIIQLGGKIYKFIGRRENPIKYYKCWNKFLKNNSLNYNSIHMHVSSLTTILPLKIAKKYGIKNRIIHSHSTSQPGKIHKIFMGINKNRIKKYATDLIACSTEAGNYVFGSSKFIVLKNGIDAQKYKFNPIEREKIRNKYGLKNDVVFTHIGRFVQLKNHEFLLNVFKKINDKKPNTKLILIGDGELRRKIENDIEKLNIKNNVILLGNINNIYQVLQGCDIFIMPSIYEGLPISCIEAQASGLKCFISDTISKETDITGLVDFISLDLGESEWANYILEKIDYMRQDVYNNIVMADYDIVSTVKILMTKYI